MSSVLKALRQQQSQLIPPQQAIQLTAATSNRAARSRWWWLALPLAVAAGWAATYWYFQSNQAPQQQTHKQETIAAQADELSLGSPQPVRKVALPSEDANKVVTSQTGPAQSATSSFQAVPEVAPDQAVDLNEVPADLLAAFEEAIAATGSGTAQTERQSVLPRIDELDRRLQQRIPAFTYDGHQYSSRAQERFVELAGQRLRQGDYWQGIQVLTIAPNHVVLALGNDAFQQPALEDWTTRP